MESDEKREWAVVTGASRGIGRAIAQELARKGYGLLLLARNASQLEELGQRLSAQHGVPCRPWPCDASALDTPARLHDYCASERLPVSILVNNAGIGVYEDFHRASLADMMRMNALNVDAVVRLTHAMLPLLLAQPRAHVLNVASTGAFQPIPTMALYAAGKAYVRSFSYAIRHELRKTSVRVTCLSPGGVWTDFMDAAGSASVSERNRMVMMEAGKCARIAVRGMFRGRAEVIPGWYNRFFAFISRVVPATWSTRVSARVFEKRD